MTTQIKDSVSYKQSDYGVVGFMGKGLFVPSSQDIEVQAATSDCWRGFFCHYFIRSDQLFLAAVTLGLSKADRRLVKLGRGPSAFGRPIRPADGKEHSWAYGQLGSCGFSEHYVVAGLEEPMMFSGGLLLGRDFIWDRHEGTVYHPAFQYSTVVEIAFEQGHVVDTTNHADPHDASPTPDFGRYNYHSY